VVYEYEKTRGAVVAASRVIVIAMLLINVYQKISGSSSFPFP